MKKVPDNDVFLTQLIRFEVGDCSPEEIAALNQEMLLDQGKRRELIHHFEQGQLIRNMSRQNQTEGNSFLLATAGPSPRHWFRSPTVAIIGLSAAAVLLLFLGVLKLTEPIFPQDSLTVKSPPSDRKSHDNAPRIMYTQAAIWAGAHMPHLNNPLTHGPWQLNSGIVTIGFPDCAQATISGPATFDVDRNNVIKLLDGELVACNDKGKNLTVMANGKRISSKGNAFGVRSQAYKTAKVCAFQGELVINSDSQDSVVLAAGSSSPIMSLSGNRQMTTSDRAPFQSSLMVATGIKAMQGSTLLFPSDIQFGLMKKEADGTAFLIPERYLSSGETIKVSQVGSGTLKGAQVVSSVVIWKSPHECRSYLLHASPSTRVKHLGAHSFVGKITFQSPIEAVITAAKLLNATEKKLANPPRNNLSLGRGLEEMHLWEKNAHGEYVSDIIKVSKDRKTLFFSLKVGNGLDQIRIITAVR